MTAGASCNQARVVAAFHARRIVIVCPTVLVVFRFDNRVTGGRRGSRV